jgi:hypothetical protein
LIALPRSQGVQIRHETPRVSSSLDSMPLALARRGLSDEHLLPAHTVEGHEHDRPFPRRFRLDQSTRENRRARRDEPEAGMFAGGTADQASDAATNSSAKSLRSSVATIPLRRTPAHCVDHADSTCARHRDPM